MWKSSNTLIVYPSNFPYRLFELEVCTNEKLNKTK